MALVVIATTLGGCKKEEPASPPLAVHTESLSSVKQNWTEVGVVGISISFPPSIKASDMTQAQASRIFDRAKQRHPNDANVFQKLKADPAKGGFKLMAKSLTPGPTGFTDNMSLIVIPTKAATIDAILKSHQKVLARMSVPGSVMAHKIKLPAGDAAYIESDHSHPGSENRAISTYLMAHDGQEFLFTFASGQPDKAEWRKTAADVMKTVKFAAKP